MFEDTLYTSTVVTQEANGISSVVKTGRFRSGKSFLSFSAPLNRSPCYGALEISELSLLLLLLLFPYRLCLLCACALHNLLPSSLFLIYVYDFCGARFRRYIQHWDQFETTTYSSSTSAARNNNKSRKRDRPTEKEKEREEEETRKQKPKYFLQASNDACQQASNAFDRPATTIVSSPATHDRPATLLLSRPATHHR